MIINGKEYPTVYPTKEDVVYNYKVGDIIYFKVLNDSIYIEVVNLVNDKILSPGRRISREGDFYVLDSPRCLIGIIDFCDYVNECDYYYPVYTVVTLNDKQSINVSELEIVERVEAS